MAAKQPSTSMMGRQHEDNVPTYLWGHREQPCWSQALGDPGVHTPDLPRAGAGLTSLRGLLAHCFLLRVPPGWWAPHSVKMTGWVTPTAPESRVSQLPLHLCAGAHALTHLHMLVHKLTLTLAHMLTHVSKFP